MDYESLFIMDGIPDRLSKEKKLILFNKMKQGDMAAREDFINNNIGLVIDTVLCEFMKFDYDKKELVAVGCLGLVKATDTYDTSRGCEFSTYARRCIYNEIITFLKKVKKNSNVLSFDDLFWKDISHDEEDTSIKLENMISSGVDVEEEYVRKAYNEIQLRLLQQSMECLSERNREIVMLYFGFYNNKRYTCEEIGKMLNISKAGVSIAIKRSLSKLKDRMNELSVREVSSNTLKRGRSI